MLTRAHPLAKEAGGAELGVGGVMEVSIPSPSFNFDSDDNIVNAVNVVKITLQAKHACDL